MQTYSFSNSISIIQTLSGEKSRDVRFVGDPSRREVLVSDAVMKNSSSSEAKNNSINDGSKIYKKNAGFSVAKPEVVKVIGKALEDSDSDHEIVASSHIIKKSEEESLKGLEDNIVNPASGIGILTDDGVSEFPSEVIN